MVPTLPPPPDKCDRYDERGNINHRIHAQQPADTNKPRHDRGHEASARKSKNSRAHRVATQVNAKTMISDNNKKRNTDQHNGQVHEHIKQESRKTIRPQLPPTEAPCPHGDYGENSATAYAV